MWLIENGTQEEAVAVSGEGSGLGLGMLICDTSFFYICQCGCQNRVL